MKNRYRYSALVLFITILAAVSLLAFGCSDTNGPDDNDDNDTLDPVLPDTSEGIRPDSGSTGALDYIGSFNVISNGVPQGIAIKDEILFVGDGQMIRALDVGNPASPAQLSQFPTSSSNYVTGLAIKGNYLYGVFENRLRVFDIASAISPAEAGTLSLGGSCRDIAIFGDYAFVGKYSDGLIVLDISNPTSPQIVETWFSYPSYSVVVGAGGILYAGSQTSFRVFQLDITEPESLGLIYTKYPYGETAFDLDYAYGHLFIAAGKASLASNNGLFNIQSRSYMANVYSDTTDYVCKGVSVEGNLAYVIDGSLSGESNLYMYYTYNPALSFRADFVNLSDQASAVLAKEGYIYILCKTSLQIYRNSTIT